jgi:hypothetical protein
MLEPESGVEKMRFAYRISKVSIEPHNHSTEYLLLFDGDVVRRTYLSVTLYALCLPCSTYRICWRITDIRLSILVSGSISVFGATKNKLRRTVWEMNAILQKKRNCIVSEIRCCRCRNCPLRRVSRSLVEQCAEAVEKPSKAVLIFLDNTPSEFLWNSCSYPAMQYGVPTNTTVLLIVLRHYQESGVTLNEEHWKQCGLFEFFVFIISKLITE